MKNPKRKTDNCTPACDTKKQLSEQQPIPKRRISVRNLVEFILREGDIDSGRGSGKIDVDAMQAGARMHRKLQHAGGSHYKSEVPLSVELNVECALLTVDGRADGVIEGALPYRQMPVLVEQSMRAWAQEHPQFVTIDEIKCMYRDVADYEQPDNLHLAQAKCYAYMYARMHGMEQMVVQITYAQLEHEQIRRFWYHYSYDELEQWFFGVVFAYTKFLKFEVAHLETVQTSARAVAFPFAYRSGQRELSANIYSSIKRQEPLFCQAPTGVGKTISAVFPSVKAIGEGMAEKLFYLTAKTVTKTVAEESLSLLRQGGLMIHSVTLSARDKLCALPERNCSPLVCPRAKGHFDRVNECLYELLVNEDNISRECIEEYAQAYEVCPYELSLDVAQWVDFVICDYNYLFDPKVQLKRFFSEQAVRGQYVFLVDEAHNLVERGRSMYSAVLSKEAMNTVQNHLSPVSQKTANTLRQLQDTMCSYQSEIDVQSSYRTMTDCDLLSVQLLRFVAQMDELLDEHAGFEGEDTVMQFYFDVHHFLNMYENLDDHYVIYISDEGADDCRIHLFCVNPSKRLSAVMEKGRSTIFFSATMLPIHYYKELLTGTQTDRAVYIPSPFDQKKRFLAIAGGVTSKYSRRGYDMYGEIVEYIRQATVRAGNYMVFFSSYKMMEDVYDVALERDLDNGRRMIIQQSHMSERDRESFLQEFQDEDKRPLIAFCILGGIFSEGIDLKEEQLIGAFIVGTGLPQIGVERDILNAYFRAQGLDGFAYAYIYPGMNKVMQAAGRVIRTEQDKGIILLMDDRFRQMEYRSLFPQEWSDVLYVNRQTVGSAVRQFWEEQENNPVSS